MKIDQDSPKNHDISYKNHEFPSKNAEVKANLQSCSSANPSELTVRPLGADPLLRGEVPGPATLSKSWPEKKVSYTVVLRAFWGSS